jgi:predicted O-methyltransferase YrrM
MNQELKNRIELVDYIRDYFQDQTEIKGAEVGVFTGYYSELLCKAMPNLHLTCCDIWGSGKYKRAEDQCLARLAPYNTTIIKDYSVEAAKQVADGSLDFVYIDGAHDYDNVKADLKAWLPKVRVGGIVAGDDFYDFPSGKGGVMQAATELTSHYHYDLKLTNWDIENPNPDDRQPSFYFIKAHDKGPQHPHSDKDFDGFRTM